MKDESSDLKNILKGCTKQICKIVANNVAADVDIKKGLDDYFCEKEKESNSNKEKSDSSNLKAPGRLWILIGQERKQGQEDKQEKHYSLIIGQSEDTKRESETHQDGSPIALMIGQSEDIRREIEVNLEIMFNEDYDVKDDEDKVWDCTPLRKAKYYYKKGKEKEKKKYLCRYLFNEYDELELYEVDIDKYLKVDEKQKPGNETINKIYQLSKDYFAEAKLAFETRALYWNYYRSGIDKRAYKLFESEENS